MTEQGRLPNVEIFSDMTFESEMNDFLTTGAVIGELGVLTGASKAYSATCETSVNAYYISMEVINKAMATFVDALSSLESRIWRGVGMKIGRHLLPVHPFHQTWHLDRIRNRTWQLLQSHQLSIFHKLIPTRFFISSFKPQIWKNQPFPLGTSILKWNSRPSSPTSSCFKGEWKITTTMSFSPLHASSHVVAFKLWR